MPDKMCQQRLLHLNEYRDAVRVYGEAVLNMDSQCPGSTNTESAETIYLNAWNYLDKQGWGGTGWIIGETCYNNQATADDIAAAQASAHNLIYYIQQWNSNYNIPTGYNYWIAEGY